MRTSALDIDEFGGTSWVGVVHVIVWSPQRVEVR